MNKEYLKELYDRNKENFQNNEYDINSPSDLEDQINSYITSNMQYDFDIEIDINRLFDGDKNIELEEPEIEK